ncbi:MAG: hypothetical protein JSR33_09870 [Proteobacteria bacterium]|nr:hypothetical protein [Pseudomonadota bacterium]
MNFKNHQQFLKAWANLHGRTINHHSAMTRDEGHIINAMQRTLQNVYGGQTTIKANYYYSPRSMRGKQPSFLSHLENPEQYKVPVPGVLDHDFKFYNIPANVERRAGKKK